MSVPASAMGERRVLVRLEGKVVHVRRVVVRGHRDRYRAAVALGIGIGGGVGEGIRPVIVRLRPVGRPVEGAVGGLRIGHGQGVAVGIARRKHDLQRRVLGGRHGEVAGHGRLVRLEDVHGDRGHVRIRIGVPRLEREAVGAHVARGRRVGGDVAEHRHAAVGGRVDDLVGERVALGVARGQRDRLRRVAPGLGAAVGGHGGRVGADPDVGEDRRRARDRGLQRCPHLDEPADDPRERHAVADGDERRGGQLGLGVGGAHLHRDGRSGRRRAVPGDLLPDRAQARSRPA